MLSKFLTTSATIACFATAAVAEDRHLVILIDRSPVEAPYPSSLARSVASSMTGQFKYGDQITIVTTGQPDAGSVDLDAEFDYRLGLKPDEIAGILDPLIAHAADNPDPSSDWVRSVEDLSTRVNCSRRDVTIVIVSNLRNPMKPDEEGAFLIYPAAERALSGCHMLFAGAGHATPAGERRQIVDLAGMAAEFWGASHALPRFKSIAAQALACAVVAATILAVAYAMAPNATPTAVRVTYVFAHEVGHLIGATAVGHSWVDFQITRDSGHVITSGGRETVAVILMGPLFPAMVAALALTLAAIQRWNVALLVTFGGSALVATILGGPFEQAVDWTLYAIAGLGAFSLAPLWPWMRAIPTFLLGMVLSIGVLESTRHFGRETLDQAQMSDAMQLAAHLAPADPTSALGDVRVIVIGLIVLIYLIITIIAANLLLHERTTP